MMRLVYHPDFLKRAQRIPGCATKKISKTSYFVLKNNPHEALLHTKRLFSPLTGLLSFRISRDWRALFQFIDEETILLVDVAHRKDIYK